MAEYTVLVVEDDPVMRKFIAAAVNKEPQLELVAAIGSVAAAKAIIHDQPLDVMLTDIDLPDGSGLDLISLVAEQSPATDIMVISIFGDEKTVLQALERGASGYILKDTSSEDMGQIILELIDGGSPISPRIARHLLKIFQGNTPALPQKKEPVSPLTPKETEVLTLISKGFNYNEAASTLGVSPSTVSTHVKSIYRKLSVHSKNEAVFEAVQMGIISLKE